MSFEEPNVLGSSDIGNNQIQQTELATYKYWINGVLHILELKIFARTRRDPTGYLGSGLTYKARLQLYQTYHQNSM